MGWFSYSIYGGDCTQTRHYDFIKWAGIKVDEDEISDWLGNRGTKIPYQYLDKFINGIPKIIKKMPKIRFWNEDSALEWQMLAALLVDNDILHADTLNKGLEATDYLIQSEHTKDFDKPCLRRAALRKFKHKILGK